MFGGQHQTDSTAGEVIERSPCVGFNNQPLPRMIQQDGLTLTTIVECHMK